jgi:lactoylglutathione lyase
MKTSIDQFCINVTDLERSVNFYEKVLGFEVTHRVEIPDVSEVILAGADGHQIQLAYQHEHEGPIDHGSALWKFYLNTDDCEGLYERCMEAGMESISAPERLEHWPVTAAFVKDPDGYMVEILQHHKETPQGLSGPEADRGSD